MPNVQSFQILHIFAKRADVVTLELKITSKTTGCIKKKFTVGKYSLNERACEICQNFQLACEVQHSLVHVALKLFENLLYPE